MRQAGYSGAGSGLEAALNELLTVFDCDRAWLLYPCDPAASSCTIAHEATREGFPGAHREGASLMVDSGYRELFRKALDGGRPVARGEGAECPVPPSLRQRYGVKSGLVLALRPATGRPWLLGIHHCRRAQRYGERQRRLLEQIGRRIALTLDRELLLAQLRENEALLRERERQLRTLVRGSRLVNQRLEAGAIREHLLDCALELVRARAGAVGLVEEGAMVFRGYRRGGEELAVDYRFGKGEGVAGWVLEHGQSYLCNDAGADPRVAQAFRRELGFARLLNVPLQGADGALHGCFELHDREDGEPFSGQDREMLEALAAVTAVAMDNQCQLQRLELSERRLRLLSQCNQALLRAHEEGALLEQMCRLAVSVGGYGACWIVLQGHGTRPPLRPVASAGVGLESLQALIREVPGDQESGGFLTRAVREKVPAVQDDLLSDPACERWVELARATGCRSAAALPLARDGILLGAICFMARQARDFDGAALHLLQELADDLAFGIDTLRLRRRRDLLEQQIEYQALHDTLTGLPNRDLAADRLGQRLLQAQREGRGGLVMLLGLDKFKRVNEIHGHAAGDRLLGAVARRLRSAVRSSDTVARFGGDEFLVVAHGLQGEEAAEGFASKLLDAFREPLQADGLELFVSVSLGIIRYPEDAGSVEALLAGADAALALAKESGRGSFRFYSPQLNERMARLLEYDRGLRMALSREELSLRYQPVVDAAGRICAIEALLRWQHPQLGTVPPDEFIAVAEENGTIVDIGYWVIRQALGDLCRWREQGIALSRVMVNLSPRQLRDAELCPRLLELVRESGLSPECLELEITEGVLMQEPERSQRLLDRLHQAGLRLSLDDFGTGYSSLAYLQRYPFDTLKIDRSFIADVDRNAVARQLVASIIQMAGALGMITIAEGVEDSGTADRLGEMGCALQQGYLYSEPVAAGELAAIAGSGPLRV